VAAHGAGVVVGGGGWPGNDQKITGEVARKIAWQGRL